MSSIYYCVTKSKFLLCNIFSLPSPSIGESQFTFRDLLRIQCCQPSLLFRIQLCRIIFLPLEENYAATFTNDTIEIIIYNICNMNDAFLESLWQKFAPIGRIKMEAYLRDI